MTSETKLIVDIAGDYSNRLLEMGLLPGERVSIKRYAKGAVCTIERSHVRLLLSREALESLVLR